MNRFLWLLAGIGLGAVVAHFIARTPAGRDFAQGVRDGYREREAELRAAIGDARDMVENFTKD